MAEVLGTMLWCVTKVLLTLCEWRAPGCGGGTGNYGMVCDKGSTDPV